MISRYKRAIEVYKEILLEPRGPGDEAFCGPPPGMRDKKWSKELRQMWPDFRMVRIEPSKNSEKIFKWCEKNVLFFWVNQSRNVWYFAQPKDAVLFKLTHGGTEI